MKRRLALRPSEHRAATLLLMILACVVVSSLAARIARDGIFLATIGPGRLPELYLVSAVLAGGVCWLLARLPRVIPQSQLFPIVMTVMGALVFASGLALHASTDPRLVAAVAVLVEVVGAASLLEFWLAAEITSFRGARSGVDAADIGDVTTFLLAVPAAAGIWLLLHVVRPTDLLFVSAAVLWTSAVPGILLAFRTPGRVRPVVPPPPWSPAPALKESIERPLLLSAGATVLLGLIVRTLADFQWKATLATVERDPGGIARWLAVVALGAALVALLVEAGAARLLRSGLGAGGVPALAGIVTGGAAIGLILLPGAPVLAALAVLGHEEFRFQSQDATLQRAVVPLPRRTRELARSLFDDTLRPLALVLAALVLLAGRHFGRDAHQAPVLLVSVILFLVTTRRLRVEHVRAFGLARGRLGEAGARRAFVGRDAAATLAKALGSSQPAEVESAMELVHLASEDMSAAVVARIEDAPSRTRVLACEYLGRVRAKAFVEPVRARLADHDRSVRAAAIRALCAIEGEAAASEVLGLLEDGDPEIEAAAAAGLIECGGAARPPAWRALKRLTASEDSVAREHGARALGWIPTAGDPRLLAALMADPVDRVRCAAMEAAARSGARDLVPAILEQLRRPETRRAAQAALVRFGAPVLGDLLRLHAGDREVACEVAHLLGRIGSAEAVQMLVENVGHSSGAIRAAVVQALARAVRQDPELRVDRHALKAAATVEAAVAYRALAAAEAFGLPDNAPIPAPGQGPKGGSAALAASLLALALADKQGRAMERIFWILAALHPEAISRPPAPEQRRAVIETLANLLDAGLRRRILPLFSDAPRARKLSFATGLLRPPSQTTEAWLGELLCDEDAFVVGCATYHIAVHKVAALKDRVLALLARPSSLVRETALRAVEPLVTVPELPGVVTPLLWDEFAPIRARVDAMLERIVDHVEMSRARGQLTRVYGS
jgi:HEAT repeat protein